MGARKATRARPAKKMPARALKSKSAARSTESAQDAARLAALMKEAAKEHPKDAFYKSILDSSAADYTAKIEKSGWLDGMPAPFQANVRKSVQECFAAPRDIRLRAMSSLSTFSVEFNDFGETYTELLETISKATWGVFAPTEITERRVGNDVKLSFRWKTKKYSRSLNGGRVSDLNVFWLVNRALRECSGQKRLVCPVPLGIVQDDWVEQTFVAPAVFARAAALGLFPKEDSVNRFYDEPIDLPDFDFDFD